MQIHYLTDIHPDSDAGIPLPASVLTIGNFDGVHLGHQAMLDKTMSNAQAQGLASAVMVFEPQPKEFFAPENAPARLTSLTEKQQLLAAQGIDLLIVARFDTAFRSLSATAFANLLKRLQVQALVLGDDFHFGQGRSGDSAFLQAQGLAVTTLTTITDAKHDGERISSTRIRTLLAAGELDAAKRLLGRDYAMIGEVIDGDKIGRTLTFPTANISLNRLHPPLHGVFAVDVQVLTEDNQIDPDAWQRLATDGQMGIAGLQPYSLFGTANLGTRPSVSGGHDWRLEVHFPEFAGSLYGQRLQVRFLHFLHGERRYANLSALQQGIAGDVADLLAWRQRQFNHKMP